MCFHCYHHFFIEEVSLSYRSSTRFNSNPIDISVQNLLATMAYREDSLDE